ncbi:MAG: NAD(P)H-hydrate dehydratase [Gammaproteobacteria bacterium]|nr:NAD(P)H-hydrate dehydratase [Gammaproteobacteria bacterium]MBT8436967.1 NAD(P)H-hydrate dehydratase [Gammaproteobacteria bacterium]
MLLFTPDKVYQLDKAAVEQDGFAEIELMQRAGRRVWQAITERWPQLSAITVFAGAGNNGGDAFVVALSAHREGVDVQLLIQGDLSRQSDTSRHYKQQWQQAGGEFETWEGQAISGEVIVDGLLGIGLQRELDDHWQELIAAINRCEVPRIAIDIPSGLNGLTGNPQPVAVEAHTTVTFIGCKTGQFIADGPDYCGELIFADLGVSRRVRQSVPAALDVIESCQLPAPRKKNTHKNHFGNLLIIGGDQGMSGAVALSARAALRSGAGLVTALVHPDCRNNLASFPEIMVSGWDAIESRLADASIVVVGPGFGVSDAATDCLHLLAQATLPMVVDASALSADFLESLKSEQLVITPHPGEAAGLLSIDSAEVQSNRLDACERLSKTFSTTCVLKGSGTLVAEQGKVTALNTHGNAGMASAGMGDVLSGIIAAMMGQGLAPFEAAKTAVFIHALSAEAYCRKHDQIGLVASDIIKHIPTVVKRLRNTS